MKIHFNKNCTTSEEKNSIGFKKTSFYVAQFNHFNNVLSNKKYLSSYAPFCKMITAKKSLFCDDFSDGFFTLKRSCGL